MPFKVSHPLKLLHSHPRLLPIILSTCNLTTGTLFGFNLAIIGQIFPSILSNEALPHEEPLEAALVVSSFLLGGIIGASRILFHSRRIEFFMSCIIAIVALVVGLGVKVALVGLNVGNAHDNTGFSINVDLILMIFIRLGLGVALGKLSSVSTLWVAELAPNHLRGSLGSLFQVSITFGILFASFSGLVICQEKWYWAMLLELLTMWSVMLLVGCIMPSNDPRVTDPHGGVSELRDNTQGDHVELENDKLMSKTAPNAFHSHVSPVAAMTSPDWKFLHCLPGFIRRTVDWWHMVLTTRKHRNSLYIAFILCLSFQFTGVQIYSYMPVIFEEAGFSVWFSGWAAIVCGLFNFLFSFIPFFSSDRCGRRPLLLMGMSLICLSMSCLGYTSLAIPKGTFQAVLTLFLFMPFMLGFQLGIGCLFFVVLSEYFDQKVRNGSVSLANSTQWFINWCCGLLFMPVASTVGIGYLYLLFSVVGIIVTFNILLFLRETRGKSL